MKEFRSFDAKAIKKKLICNKQDQYFKKEIFNNEIVWTYLTGEIAKDNSEIYKMIATFDASENHSIYFEGQPKSPYIRIEGNSYIDMALGALKRREKTQSGLAYSKGNGNEVCFVEAKYLSDLSTKTEHSPIRNQMERVIENLLVLEDTCDYPENVVFTLLTPRVFKKEFGSRIYSYKYREYEEKLGKDNDYLAKKIEFKIDYDNKRFEHSKTDRYILDRLNALKINWVTFEDIFEMYSKDLFGIDITKEEDAIKAWNTLRRKLSIT